MRCERECDWILAPAGNVSRFDGDNGNQKNDRCFWSNLVLVCPSDAVRLLDTCLKLSPRFLWLRSSSVRSILALKPASFLVNTGDMCFPNSSCTKLRNIHTWRSIVNSHIFFFVHGINNYHQYQNIIYLYVDIIRSTFLVLYTYMYVYIYII